MADGLGLPAGTRVQLKGGAKLTGTVMPYAREYSRDGLFPVRLDNCICQICHTSDVIVLDTTEAPPPVSEQPPRKRRKATTRSETDRTR